MLSHAVKMDRKSEKTTLIVKCLNLTMSATFLDLGSILLTGITIKHLKNFFLILNCPIQKIKVSEAHSSRLCFQETVAHKGKWCTK